jgi:adenosine deaminase
VSDAIELLGADRIDHGVRAIEDERVMALLAERQIPLGICPTSNLTLKVYRSMAAHPIDRLRLAGVRVSVNTDDPGLLRTNLPQEYHLAGSAFGWTDDTVRDVALTSIEASFANADTKARLKCELSKWELR